MAVRNAHISPPDPYTCEIIADHPQPEIFKPPAIPPQEISLLLHQADSTDTIGQFSVDGVCSLARSIAQKMPASRELAYSIDETGYFKDPPQLPAHSTHWVNMSSDGLPMFVRFSEARTAMHSLGMLRTIVESGIVLEATTQPENPDISYLHSVFVFQPAIHIWDPAQTRVLDLNRHIGRPPSARAIPISHSDEVGSVRQKRILEISREVIGELLGETLPIQTMPPELATNTPLEDA